MSAALIIVLVFVMGGVPRQLRDADGRVVTENGSISGAVFEGAEAPVHGVAVTLRGPSLRAGRLAVTDADGRFVFPNLPSGNFTMEAVCPGFVRTFYGSALAGKGPGVAIAVGSGESVAHLTIRMIRGGVISGTVRDAYAQPQPNAEVTVIPVTSRGTIEDKKGVVFTTDESGRYRAYGLAPGRYLVAVQPGFNYNGATRYSPQQLDELVSGRASPLGRNTGPTILNGYAPVFFPGSTIVQSAAILEVDPGQEVGGIDVSFQFVQMTRLDGRVAVPSGMVLTDIDLRIESPGSAGLELRAYLGTRPGAGSIIRVTDSTFQRNGLVPGRYALSAVATAVGPSGATSLWARAEIHAAGQEVISVAMDLQPSLIVSGSVDTVGSGRVASGNVLLRSADDIGANPRVASIGVDGGFAFQGVVPGRYWIDTDFPGEARWNVVNATLGSSALLDDPLIVMAGQDVKGVRATISNQPSLRGRLVDPAGRITTGYVIVVFSSDKAHWSHGRRVVVSKPSSSGQYTVPALPGGEYLICAAPDADPIDLRDPAYLEVASQSALKVTVGLGKTLDLDLQIPVGIR